jgi:hypothetical protein
VRNIAREILQVVCPRTADDDGIVQEEVCWLEVVRRRHRRLSEAQGATGHSLL